MVDSGCSKKNKFNFSFGFRSSYKIILLVLVVAVLSIIGSSLVSILMSNSTTDIYIPSVGNIKTLEVEAYTDSAYANKIDQISWDTLEPGKTVNTTIYIKSVSNVEITLDIHLTDWVPSNLSKYITISWDYDGSSLNPREGIPVTLMLSASSSDDFIYYLVENEVQNFNVDVHFVGSA